MLNTAPDGHSATSSAAADVLVKTAQQLIRLLFLSYILAWLLSNTSSYPVLNWPVALLVVLGAKWLAAYVDQHATRAGTETPSQRYPTVEWRSSSFAPHVRHSGLDRDGWRAAVNSKIIELAWEKFCGSILQEWVYDAWYSYLTPDREFPCEIRQLLNTLFGELCIRGRRVDVRTTLIKDVSDIIIDNLQLYRQTVDAIGPRHFQHMTSAAKESAFQSQLKSEDKLHAALQSPDGHYKVLRGLSDEVMSLLLPPQERDLALARALVRELLAACVLRPTMMYFTPYCINQIFLSMFPEEVRAAARPTGSSKTQFEGSQGFEARAQQSAALEQHHHLERLATHGMMHGDGRVPASGRTGPVMEHAPVPASVRVGMQTARRRSAHMRSRSWDDGILPPSHALDTTYASSMMSTMDGSRDEGFRSDGEPHSLRQVVAHRSLNARSDVLSPSAARGGQTSVPGGAEASPTPVSSPVTQAGALTAAAATMTQLPSQTASPSTSVQPSPQSSPTRASQLSAAPALGPPQGQQNGQGGPTPGRPAFDAIAEMTAASLLQQHQSQHEQAGARGQLQAVMLDASTFHDGSKNFVLYQIQVCEGASMWTVSRRYRNFEALHKRLRDLGVYREQGLLLPSKRLMVHTNDKSFVAKRRNELQEYLDSLLQDPRLARCDEVRKFLSSVSSIYCPDDSGGLLKVVDMATSRAKRAVGGALGEGLERITFLSSSMRDSTRRMGALGPRLRAVAAATTKGVASSLPPLAASITPPAGGLQQHADPTTPLSPFALGAPPDPSPPFATLEGTSGIVSAGTSRAQGTGAESPPPTITRAPPAVAAAGSGTPGQDAVLRQGMQTPGINVGEGGSRRGGADAGGGPDDYVLPTGISAPLYTMVVAVFELQGRGFFRRQVVTLATQMLSLVAGDAIDSYLGDQLKALSSEPNIARWISTLQNSLWPGGVWFTVAAAAAANPAATTTRTTLPATKPPAAAAAPGKDAKLAKAFKEFASHLPTPAAPAVAGSAPVKAPCMQPESFMEPYFKPTDEAEVAGRVKAKLFAAAPAALVRLVGQKCYTKSMTDVYEMLQSPTFTYQIGFRVLETLAMALFPELRES